MAFPFPSNPVDGQTVSYTANDGSLLQATYVQSKNTWDVKRSASTGPVLLSRTMGVTLPTATADGQVIMWDVAAQNWKASAISLSTKNLLDVDRAVTPSNGYILVYDQPNSRYKPVPLTGGAVLTVNTAGVQAKISGGAATVSAALSDLFYDIRPAAQLKGGDIFIVTATKNNAALDKYAGTYFYTGSEWLLAVGSQSGGSVNYRTSASTAQKPGTRIGDFDILNEANNKQLNVFDGSSYQPLFSESQIKQWIAAGNLYQGTLTSDSAISSLPAPSSANRGYYWVWVGSANHSITTPITATLNSGDWLQSNGTVFTHIPAASFSKERWDNLGSFKTWVDGAYEASSLVYHNNSFYRASSAVIAGDPAPDAAGNTKWQKLALSFSLDQLTNVSDDASVYGMDCVLAWSEANQEWIASRDIDVDSIEFDESGPGVPIAGIASQTMTVPQTSDPDTWVPSVTAVKDFVANINLEDLGDTQPLKSAVNGDTPIYNETLGVWEAKKVGVSSIANIGDVLINSTPQKGDVLKWDSDLTKWTSSPPKLTELGDVNQGYHPQLGEMPIWSYPAGHPSTEGKFFFKSPNAHIKSWDPIPEWESGAVVYHHGGLWRAVFTNHDVEPEMEPGRVTLFINVRGEPSFGIVPMGLAAGPPASGHQPMPPSKFAYHVDYQSDRQIFLWKWVLKGRDPVTHEVYGEWELKPTWTCIVWRGITPPPAKVPPNAVMVWIYTSSGNPSPPVLGQQKWAPLEIDGSLATCTDVDAVNSHHHDILVYDTASRRWVGTRLQDFANTLKPFLGIP
jgi:hypothetical protein